MLHPQRPRPPVPSDSRKTIPVSIVIDGVEVTGEIVFLNSTDLGGVIRSPPPGFGTCLHVPWFAAGYEPTGLPTSPASPTEAPAAQTTCSRSYTTSCKGDHLAGAFPGSKRTEGGQTSIRYHNGDCIPWFRPSSKREGHRG